jgi:hypothetical protein
MSTVQKNTIIPLYFNSKDRFDIGDTTTNYTIKLRKSLRNISSIDVLNVGIPQTYTNININNNILLVSFKTEDTTEDFSVSVDLIDRDYTEEELRVELQTLLNTNAVNSLIGLVWSVNYDTNTKFYELSVVYNFGTSITWFIEFTYTPLIDLLGIGAGRTTASIYSITNSETLVINKSNNVKGDSNRRSALFSNLHFNITSKVLTNDINTSYISNIAKSFNVNNNSDLIVFDTIQTMNNKINKLPIGTESIGTVFHGRAISMSGDASVIVSGAYRDEGFVGSIYTYTIDSNETIYTQQGGKTTASNHASANSQEGFSVAIDNSGSTMVTGAPGDDWQLFGDASSPSKQQGAAYIYTWNGISWTQILKILPTMPLQPGETAPSRTHQELGKHVAISGDGNTVAVSGDQETILLDKIAGNFMVKQSFAFATQPHLNNAGSILFLNIANSIQVWKKSTDIWTLFQTIPSISSVSDTTTLGTTFVTTGLSNAISVYDDTGTYTINASTPISIPSINFGISTSISGDGNTIAIGDTQYTTKSRVVTVSQLASYVQSGTGVGATLTSTAFTNINDIGIDGITDLVVNDSVLVTSTGSSSDVHNGIYIITSVGVTGVSSWVLTRSPYLNTDAKTVFGFSVSVTDGVTSKKTGYYIDTINGISQVGKGKQGTSNPHDLITIDTTPFAFKKIGSNNGKVWIYTKVSGEWFYKIVITGSDTSSTVSSQGTSVKLSDNGNTVSFGGPDSNYGVGGVWVWKINTFSVWEEIQPAIYPTGFLSDTNQGISTSISKYGKTFISGGPLDTGNLGAAWVYERSGNIWTQQGSKLVASDSIGNNGNVNFGWSVAISHDGSTVAIGGPGDFGNGTLGTETGAVWIFRRVGTTWTQQGLKIIGSSSAPLGKQGYSVSLNGNGNILAVTGKTTNIISGIYVYRYNGVSWSEYTNSPLKHSAISTANQFESVSLSEDGLTLVAGTPIHDTAAVFNYEEDLPANPGVFIWREYPTLLSGIGNEYGMSVSISGDGTTIAVGAPGAFETGVQGYVTVWVKTYTTTYSWLKQVELTQTPFGNSVNLSIDGNVLSVGALASISQANITSETYVYVRNPTTQIWSQYSDPIVGDPRTNTEDWQGYSTSVEYLDDSLTDFVLIIGAVGYGIEEQNFIGGNWSFFSGGDFPTTETFQIENRAYTIFDLLNTLNSTMVTTNMVFKSVFDQDTETITFIVVGGENVTVTFKLNTLTTFDIAEFLISEYASTLTSLQLDFSINNNIIKSVDTSGITRGIIYDNTPNRSFRKYEAGYTISENELIDIQLRDERDRIIDLNGADWIMTVYATIHN